MQQKPQNGYKMTNENSPVYTSRERISIPKFDKNESSYISSNEFLNHGVHESLSTKQWKRSQRFKTM